MQLKWKCVKMATIASFLLVLPGCAGLAATQSISPLSFLLPGFVLNETNDYDPELTEIKSNLPQLAFSQ